VHELTQPFRLHRGSSAAHAEGLDRSLALEHLSAAAVAETAGDAQRIAGLVRAYEDIAMRTCRPGHLTGSAVVIDPSRCAMLLLFHTKLQRWLQPGGHADGDMNLARVALREAEEETGIVGLQVVTPAVDVDIHEVAPPAEDAHLHLDLRFLVLAPNGSEFFANHESQDMVWVTLAELEGFEVDEGLRRMAVRGFKVAAEIVAGDAPAKKAIGETGNRQ